MNGSDRDSAFIHDDSDFDETVSSPHIGSATDGTEVENTVVRDASSRRANDADGRQPLPTVPGYEIQGILGRGGMGIVYRARDKRLKRPVALKMILGAEYADPKQIDRFRIEAETVARLSHSNIVQIYEIGEHNGLPYVSLELIEGGNLSQAIRTRQPMFSVAQITRDIALGVASAHEQGIVHRDLKPSNILLEPTTDAAGSHPPHAVEFTSGQSGTTVVGSAASRSGGPLWRQSEQSTWLSTVTENDADETIVGRVPRPKITDFGLARQLDAVSEHTRTGDVLGTPSYMAPEQAAGLSKNVGLLADVYSLGAILYALLTGRPPFAADNVVELLDQVRLREPLPPSRIVHSIPLDLETICLKCLEKQPERRYVSAQALADELQRYLSGEPIEARPIGKLERAWRWCKRKPAWATMWALASVLLATLSIGGPFVALRQAESARTQRVLRQKADANKQLAIKRANEAQTARDEARESERAMTRQVARLDTIAGLRLLDDGDALGALVYLTDALKLNEESIAEIGSPTERAPSSSTQTQDIATERVRSHRQLLASILTSTPQVVQLWLQDGIVGHAEFSRDGRWCRACLEHSDW